MEFIIEKKDLLHFCRRQCFGQILLCDIEKLTDLFVLLKFSDPVRSETENVIRMYDAYNVDGSEKPSDAAQMLGLTYELG